MRFVRRLFLGVCFVAACTSAFAIFHPRSPLPPEWNPRAPLRVTDPVSMLTPYKLRNAMQSAETCFASLDSGAEFVRMPDLETTEVCNIRDRVELRSVAGMTVAPFETRCQTALRLAMWAEHGIKPAASEHFSSKIERIVHNSSYNCRQIRAPGGSGGRMSTHATAEAVDISGVVFQDGRRLSLLDGWPADDARGAFFRDLRDNACKWFRVTLGPEYNRLHADHFHLQHTGWGLCR